MVLINLIEGINEALNQPGDASHSNETHTVYFTVKSLDI